MLGRCHGRLEFFSCEVGRDMVRLRLSISHPSTHFLHVQFASTFLSFFNKFGSFCVDLPGTLGMKTLYIAQNTWL